MWLLRVGRSSICRCFLMSRVVGYNAGSEAASDARRRGDGGMGSAAEVVALVRLAAAARRLERQTPAAEEHWAFAYTMLRKLSRSFAFVIQQLAPTIRDAICVFYLVLRALDTVEDDNSIPAEVKLPVLEEFYRRIYNRDWHFSCGTKDERVLMDKFHHLSKAFLELDLGYQKAIEEITRRMGAGMAKFVCKEVETVDDYNEYCHYTAGLVGYGLSRLFYAAGMEDFAPDSLSNSMGLFLQKAHRIKDYFEDINEKPKSRMFWPREIWSKYAEKLEDFKYEENSQKAVQCLNEMVTNALIHAEDCLQFLSALQDPTILHFCAVPQIAAMGTFALCYSNVNIFRGSVKMRQALSARIVAETNSMSDVYTAFYEFSSLLESKIDDNDPNAALTRQRINAIKKTCESSGLLQRRGYDLDESIYNSALIVAVLLMVAIVLGVLYAK